MSEQPEISRRLEVALTATQAAAELIMPHYQSADLAVESKGDESPVTVADKGAEKLIRERLFDVFPDDSVLGEEFDDVEGTSGYRWVLDPIDGTKSFIHGVPLFGTLAGLEYDGRLVAGVCRFPALNEVVYASLGEGAWWQRRDQKPVAARVSDISDMSQALFCTTTITRWEQIGRTEAFHDLCTKSKLTRGWGDCYGHILVATGRAEVMIDPELSAWDCAALIPIMVEAGGDFVDWTGKRSMHSGNGLSVNAALKDEILAILQ
ncbi:Histidinol-phosphatase [Symmachiella dynata]|uniref:histidinol-phosphatase n=2 Tax=Symmachiella dynata TaxID=2527995 RepID=UPI0011883182|nr:histidinol-phosphatase [Symmachiella dynata]QDT50180.1 Histidinol-phosphatase [Symmachiella dynata]